MERNFIIEDDSTIEYSDGEESLTSTASDVDQFDNEEPEEDWITSLPSKFD